MRKSVRNGIGLLTVALPVKYLLERFGENLFGTFYSKQIEPVISKELFYVVLSYTLPEEFTAKERHVVCAVKVDFATFIIVTLLFVLVIYAIISSVKLKHEKDKLSQKKVIGKAMEALVADKDMEVDAAQVYCFHNGSTKKIGQRRYTSIIVEHVVSKCNEDVDINAVIRESFNIEIEYYKTIVRFEKQMQKYESSGMETDKSTAKQIVKNLLFEIHDELSKLQIEDVEEKHCIHFILYKGIQFILGEENFDDPIPNCSEELCNTLRYSKKTSCLPAILLSCAYIFRNGASRFKHDRMYLTVSPSDENLPTGYKRMVVVLSLSYERCSCFDISKLSQQLTTSIDEYLCRYCSSEGVV